MSEAITHPAAQDEMIQVIKIELMEQVDGRRWESMGGYIIQQSELGPHMAGLVEGDGPDDTHSYMVTPLTMSRAKFESLDDFGGW